jgi:hypothetical protein
MEQGPRRAGQPLFGRPQLVETAVQGATMLMCLLAFYLLLQRPDVDAGAARLAAFSALGGCHLAVAVRSESSDDSAYGQYPGALWAILGVAALGLVAIAAIPALQKLLHFAPLGPGLAAVALLAGSAIGGAIAPAVARAVRATSARPVEQAAISSP